jgi:pyrroloquinoline quinone biosynthesis protein D
MKVRLAKRARLKRDQVRGIDVLLMPEAVLELNPEGAEVLALCDGTRTEEEIVGEMSARHPGAAVVDDVRAFLRRIDAKGLLERG